MRNKVLVVAGLLVGCAPSYSVWERGLDSFVGTQFYSHVYRDCTSGCGSSYWSPVNKNEVFDRVVDEGGYKRYYVTWIRSCKYSILVSGNGVIKSWRYETDSLKDCYVF